jgi:hypothetical protein
MLTKKKRTFVEFVKLLMAGKSMTLGDLTHGGEVVYFGQEGGRTCWGGTDSNHLEVTAKNLPQAVLSKYESKNTTKTMEHPRQCDGLELFPSL